MDHRFKLFSTMQSVLHRAISRFRQFICCPWQNQHKVDMAIMGQPELVTTRWHVIDEQQQLKPASLYLIDHMGLIVLEYPFSSQPQENRLIQKGLLRSKKLLNYSRSS